MLLALLCFNLMAQQVLVPAPEVSDIDFQKQIVQRPQAMTAIQAHGLHQKESSVLILNELRKGQFEFLEGEIDQAKAHFQKIQSMKWDHDWNHKEQKAIFFSIIRLAQLSTDADQTHQYLLEAKTFNPYMNPSESVFPPPLITAYQKTSLGKKKVFALPDGADKFEKVIINGKSQLGRVQFIEEYDRTARVTLLSQRYAPQSWTLPLAQLKNQKIKLEPLLQSTGCEIPVWHKSLPAKARYQRINPDCHESLPSKDQAFVSSTSTPLYPPHPTTTVKTQKFSSIWKSPWLWGGVSILVTGLVIHHQNQKSGGNSPLPMATPPPVQPPSEVLTLTNN